MYPILKKIDTPSALRDLTQDELIRLAEEVREFTIDCVSRTGGHLGASLGVVELTIALHRVFNTPKDRLIWDVGHQSYPHKILTGRREQMSSLRQRGGLSGFTHRGESPYDPFGTGHSSTSISAALGFAIANRLSGGDRWAIAVIGDGAMSAGMAFEALNNAGQYKNELDLLVVLNDNEMSISRNVGALSAYLSRILSGPVYTRLKGGTGKVLGAISLPLLDAARRAEEHMKGMLIPGTLFEELGMKYFGPINGHDFRQLLPTLKNIRDLKGPLLLHVVTRKGKGFPPAEVNPCTYHGVSPFDRSKGVLPSNGVKPTYTQVFSETLIQLAKANPKICAITAAMPEGTGLSAFHEQFPHRFFDVGIAEQHAVTFAAGLACEGYVPVVAIYSSFMQRAFDQTAHDVVLQQLPVVFALDRAGIVGEDGPTHAGFYDLTFLRSLPNLVIMAPADENQLRHMLLTAVNLGKPVAIRYPRGAALNLDPPQEPEEIVIGSGRILCEGDQVSILAVGAVVFPSLQAAEKLRAEGIRVGVYDLRFVKPLDELLIRRAVASAPIVLTVEENTVCGGAGAAILEFLAADGALDRGLKIRNLGVPDRIIPHGPTTLLRNELKLDTDGIMGVVRNLLK
ncbi:MAG: 1-deoxy-D-xylulose-5-phosphate synthase [Magnetococcales bacterium]|nr:1-deoxy-D-xylulose-5-phosphate synthase [Magnetococcales bacterium]HIJ83139.1 1-deoxy-D-xylulose-5-phosphate synthase [Magnetococcales bacterium]